MKRSFKSLALAACIVPIGVNAQLSITPIGFEENVGQLRHPDGTPASEVLYKWHGKDFNMLFLKDRFVYEFHYATKDALVAHAQRLGRHDQRAMVYKAERIEYRLPDESRSKILASAGGHGKFSYRSKDPELPHQPQTFERLTYKEAFPNVDIVFTTTEKGECKYDIVLREGAELSHVRFQLDDRTARKVRTDERGVVVDFEFGQFREEIPLAYVVKSGQRTKQVVNYGQPENGKVGFAASAIHQRIPANNALIIDPIGSLQWSTYFGPTGGSYLSGVVAQPDGVVYVCGQFKGDWPVADTGEFHQGAGDIMVAKLHDTDGILQTTDLVWCKLFGGESSDFATDIDVCNGLVAVCGATYSDQGIATDTTLYNDGIMIDSLAPDGFLIYVDGTDGTQLLGTYIGGNHGDYSRAVSFDCRVEAPGTRCYVASYTEESFLFGELGAAQAQASPFQSAPIFFNSQHAVLQQFGLTGLNWTTFYSTSAGGGLDFLAPLNMTVDRSGNPVMVCGTDATGASSLGLNGAWPYNGGGSDLVIASFSDSASLNWARWWGTPYLDGSDIGVSLGASAGLAIGPGNEVYVGSHSWDGMGLSEAFVSAVTNDNVNNERWRVLLPSPQACDNSLNELSVGCTGTVFAIGQNNCADSSAYVIGTPLQGSFAGGFNDGYIAEIEDLNTSGSIDYLSYFGSDTYEIMEDVCAEQPGNVYVCGTSFIPDSGYIFEQGGITDWDPFGNAIQGFVGRISNDCCPVAVATVIIPDGTSASGMGIFTFTNEIIRVEGDWFIDASVSLLNCTVYAMTGSQMIVTGTLYLDNTHISACQDMWKGIWAQDPGTGIRMVDSSVLDAQYGVQLDYATNLYALRSEFLNNYVGVYIKKPCVGCVNTVGLTLHECLFASVGTGLIEPYPGQAPAPGTIGYAGVLAYEAFLNITSPAPDGDNRFHTLNHGIVTVDVGFTLAEARFENIQPDPAYGTVLTNGAAIFSMGYGSFYTLDQTGKGIGAGDPATFTDCRTGIWTESMTVTSTANKMLGPQMFTGYQVRYSGGRKVDILWNDLDVQLTGVDLRFNDGADLLSVHDNKILFGTIGGGGTFPGIRVVEMNGTNTASEILNNQLDFRPAASVRTAISLSSASNYVVAQNVVSMTTQANNLFGINAQACSYSRIACNNIFGLGTWASNWNGSSPAQSGIRHSMGDNDYIGCNNVTFIRQGITFNGYTSGTAELQGNNFGYHETALLLTQNCLIGPQVLKGNIWNVPAVPPAFDAEWMTASAGLNIFEVNPVNPLCLPLNYSPLDWFFSTAQPNDECSNIMPECPANGFQGGGGERSALMDETVMQGLIQNGIYTDETQLTLAYELYMALYHDPTLYANGQYTADFVAMMANSVADDLRDVELDRQELYRLPPVVLSQVQQNANDIAVLRAQIVSAETQIAAGGLSGAQIAALQTSIAGWQQSVVTLNTYNETALVNINAAREVAALMLESESGLISSNELIEQNAKAVNAIYFNTVGKSGENVAFSAAQASELLAIASQCPLVGGNPVYQARSLYSLIDDEADFDDALLCIAAGYVVRNDVTALPHVNVYPNPNRDGQLFFDLTGLDETKEHQGTVTLYDTQGQEVGSQIITTGRAQVDVSKLAQGVYHWTIRMDGTILNQGKVTIF